MTNKELKRMSRADLIEIIYQYKRRNDDLTEDNEKLRKQLNDRIVKIEQAGSIADAVLALNNVFEAAQQAADDYLDSLRSSDKENEAQTQMIIDQAQKKADSLRKAADRYYKEMISKADREYADRIAKAEEECSAARKIIVSTLVAREKMTELAKSQKRESGNAKKK